MKDRSAAGLSIWFAATVLLGAFLLFQVQPLFSKVILPWFGGSPAVWTTNVWACAAGIASLQVIMEENLPANAAKNGAYMLDELRILQKKNPMIREVRGRGLSIGIEFEKPAQGIVDKLTGGMINKLSEDYVGAMAAGELLNRHRVFTAFTFNNPYVIRMEPPLTVTRSQLDSVLEKIADVFNRNRGFMSVAISGAKTAVNALLARE